MKKARLITVVLVVVLLACSGSYTPTATAVPTQTSSENQEEVTSTFPGALEVRKIAEWKDEDSREKFRLYEVEGTPCLVYHYSPAVFRVNTGYNVTMECGSDIADIMEKFQ